MQPAHQLIYIGAMGFTPTEQIWFNGQLVPWRDATVHVLAHGLQYGTGVFEGMRSYTPEAICGKHTKLSSVRQVGCD